MLNMINDLGPGVKPQDDKEEINKKKESGKDDLGPGFLPSIGVTKKPQDDKEEINKNKEKSKRKSGLCGHKVFFYET